MKSSKYCASVAEIGAFFTFGATFVHTDISKQDQASIHPTYLTTTDLHTQATDQ